MDASWIAPLTDSLLSMNHPAGTIAHPASWVLWAGAALLLASFEGSLPNHRTRTAAKDRSRSHSRTRPLPRLLVVGAGMVGQSVARGIEAGGRGLVVGFVDDACDGGVVAGDWPLLGGRDEVTELVRRHDIDGVVVAYAPTWQQRLVDDLSEFCPGTAVEIVPTPYEAMMRVTSLRTFDDIALVRLSTGVDGIGAAVKRGFDLAASLLGLLLLAPALLAAALLIRVTSRGPVLFAQERVGRGGSPFTLYKLRTMVYDAERETGPVLAEEDDPRLTGVGRWLKRFRLDEFPQLWNVLVGEMSLVGPRPERPVFVERFTQQTPAYARRHEVRPGITGLAQVCGGYHTDARDKLRFDLIYVSHRSLWLDLVILIRTVGVLRRHR